MNVEAFALKSLDPKVRHVWPRYPQLVNNLTIDTKFALMIDFSSIGKHLSFSPIDIYRDLSARHYSIQSLIHELLNY